MFEATRAMVCSALLLLAVSCSLVVEDLPLASEQPASALLTEWKLSELGGKHSDGDVRVKLEERVPGEYWAVLVSPASRAQERRILFLPGMMALASDEGGWHLVYVQLDGAGALEVRAVSEEVMREAVETGQLEGSVREFDEEVGIVRVTSPDEEVVSFLAGNPASVGDIVARFTSVG